MTLLVVIYSMCAVGIIAYTFSMGKRQEATDRQIEELTQQLTGDDSGA
jgi:hypothetical protein